jgi:hypothetical protein
MSLLLSGTVRHLLNLRGDHGTGRGSSAHASVVCPILRRQTSKCPESGTLLRLTSATCGCTCAVPNRVRISMKQLWTNHDARILGMSSVDLTLRAAIEIVRACETHSPLRPQVTSAISQRALTLSGRPRGSLTSLHRTTILAYTTRTLLQ